jgi:hypothetical protein
VFVLQVSVSDALAHLFVTGERTVEFRLPSPLRDSNFFVFTIQKSRAGLSVLRVATAFCYASSWDATKASVFKFDIVLTYYHAISVQVFRYFSEDNSVV